jgi:acyl-CoA reductase-like NAD-dependent aldehyde dehydrogenase
VHIPAKVALEDELQYEDETMKIIATHTPLGVVGAITPWNFPLILTTVKIFSALVTGNCVIVKPSPYTPCAVLKFVELARGIVPPGVVQGLSGGSDIGTAICTHPGISKISFTGSIATGRKVSAAAAPTLKKVTLELSGNDAAIILPDVDLEKVVRSVAGGGFFNAGQVCVATKRVYVHESIYEAFLQRLVAEVEAGFQIQDSSVPGVFMPLSNKMQYDIIKSILEECKTNGDNIVSGGVVPEKVGYWVQPTLISKPAENSRLVQEEQFGKSCPLDVCSL